LNLERLQNITADYGQYNLEMYLLLYNLMLMYQNILEQKIKSDNTIKAFDVPIVHPLFSGLVTSGGGELVTTYSVKEIKRKCTHAVCHDTIIMLTTLPVISTFMLTTLPVISTLFHQIGPSPSAMLDIVIF
jgi:hypothetical protein